MSTAPAVIFELPFKAPYDWARVLRFFAGRATPGVEAVENGTYRRAIEWDGASGTLCVARHARKHRLVVTVEGDAGCHAEALMPHVATMFDVDANPAAIGAHLARDPWLAPLLDAAPGLRLPGAWSAFELVVRAIVGQQVSVKAATTIIGRLVMRAGEPIADHPHPGTAWRFPTPAALADADLVQIGMPGKRVAALQGLARAVASGEMPIDDIHAARIPAASLAQARAALLALPGIGPWTVEYIAMRAWRDVDAFPATDLVLMQAIAERDPTLVRAPAQRARTEAWRPFRAYAAMHLWNEIADRAGGQRGG
ncbi:DNA-3-methyladenine glycosylase family protein [Trinickia dinghuensis]|uniref:DNA-3-methyladenine glycosylase II n=1 Tax=Trinickia dinghuensis TaxID=2291023 RepID=A0A3D8K109_9BURK|nr:DNA-3-methyladenine glycosylase [Trinickia dinghuensis]RDU98525.1 DNA-3-methyladenine glycosylase 2 family protein [Trinickia dinghuensis]